MMTPRPHKPGCREPEDSGSDDGTVCPAVLFPDGCHGICPLTRSWQLPSEVERALVLVSQVREAKLSWGKV